MNKTGVFLGIFVVFVVAAVFYTYYIKSIQKNQDTASLITASSQQFAGTDGMMAMNMASSVTDEKSFLESMIPHHQEAINSSSQILTKTQNSALAAFANKVVLDQTQEVVSMKAQYKEWYGKEYSGQLTTTMMGNMSSLTGIDADKAYIAGMIEHHKGAIAMAEKVLTFNSLHPETKTLANTIITHQKAEIATLNEF